MIYDQLTFAREYRGLTQTALAKRVSGLSQSNLSKFEKGVGTLSADALRRIMQELDFPMEFLSLSINNAATSENFRKKAGLNSATRNMITRFTKLVAYALDQLFEDMEVPAFNIPQIDIESGVTPEEIAQIVRRKFRLGTEPVRDIYGLLERNGVFIYEWECNHEGFDGVSMTTDAGNHLIIINKNYTPDRKRFTLAHELGHIVMHSNSDFILLSSRDKEREANAFAGEFLLPHDVLRNALVGLRAKDLPSLKNVWLVSMQSIARRAKELNAIDERRYTNLMISISKNGWRMKEPIEVYIDAPVVIDDVKRLAHDEIGYTISEMSRFMHLPTDVVQDVLSMRRSPMHIVCKRKSP